MSDSYAVSTGTTGMMPYPTWLQAASGDTAIQYSGADWRLSQTLLYPQPGIIRPADFKVTQRGAGANFSVDIAAGRAAIGGTSNTDQETFGVRSDSTVNLTTPSAPGSGTRIHRIVAELLDKQAAGSAYGWQFHLLEDTGSGTPGTPASSINIGKVSITSGQSSVTNANITDTRTPAGRWQYSSPYTTPWPLAGGGGLPTAFLYQNSIQTASVLSTWVPIAFDANIQDTLSGHSGSSTKYVCQMAGPYRMTGKITWATYDGAGPTAYGPGQIEIGAALAVNGSMLTGGAVLQGSGPGNNSSVLSPTMTRWLKVGDYVELWGWVAAMAKSKTPNTYPSGTPGYETCFDICLAGA